MINPYNPDDYVSETSKHTCEFHKKYPEFTYAGCTCSGSYSSRRATPEERKQNRKRRLEEEQRREKARKEFPYFF